jgi:ferric-dicitrate binding protein FerR (iron transport regulator)
MKTPSQAKSENDDADEQRRAKNREAAARYRERNREKVSQRMREWREANREKSREHARNWRNRKIASSSPEEVVALRAIESAKTKRNQDRCRQEVFEAYGGFKCACCGETERLFLSIDHVHNDGAQMRKAKLYSGNGTGFYQWLRKNGFPDGFQVLCMNCQIGKHKNGGVCPHQRKV